MTYVDDILHDDAAIIDVARRASHCHDGQVRITTVIADLVAVTNMTTAGLVRLVGTVDDPLGARPWSVIIKVVQTPTRSPAWSSIPIPFRDAALTELPWRSEADIYTSALRGQLPVGLRMPDVYRIDEIDDGATAIWMEDVAHDSGPWTLTDYRRAARLLGRMAGLHVAPAHATIPAITRNLRGYLHGRVRQGTLPVLADEATWSHPLIAGSVAPRLRDDIASLDAAADGLLDRLDALPGALAHGDAAPQNLLRSGDTFVAIDWQFVGICTIGFDAGQLLAGRAESGDLAPAQLAATLSAIIQAYTAGVHEEAPGVSPDAIRLGAIGTLLIRSAFTALPVELLGDDPTPDLQRLFARRARYATFLFDLASRL